MKFVEIQKKSPDELKQLHRQLSEEVFRLKFTRNVRGQANPTRLRNLRKDLARVETAVNGRTEKSA